MKREEFLLYQVIYNCPSCPESPSIPLKDLQIYKVNLHNC